MTTLQDWKDNTIGPWNWSVDWIQNDTDGLNTTEFVIYGGAAKRVKRSGTAVATGTDWGEITGENSISIVGKTLGSKKLFLRISCPGGKLKGELSKQELKLLPDTSHKGGPDHLDPPPGSWTAAEGSGLGSAFHREREKERAA